MTTLHTIVAWHDAKVENPVSGNGRLLTIVNTLWGYRVQTEISYWRERGEWVDGSGDPCAEGVVLFWAHLKDTAPDGYRS